MSPGLRVKRKISGILIHSLSPRTSRSTALGSPSHSKSRIYQKSSVKPEIGPTPRPATLLFTIWVSEKTVQAKDRETLPVFLDFQKKLARTPFNLRKSGLTKTLSNTHPIKAASDRTLPTRYDLKDWGQKTRPAKRAAKSGSPYYCVERLAG